MEKYRNDLLLFIQSRGSVTRSELFGEFAYLNTYQLSAALNALVAECMIDIVEVQGVRMIRACRAEISS
jgi:hypothetical protein